MKLLAENPPPPGEERALGEEREFEAEALAAMRWPPREFGDDKRDGETGAGDDDDDDNFGDTKLSGLNLEASLGT